MKKRIIAIACLIAICLSIPSTSMAYTSYKEEEETPPTRWTNTASILLGINFTSGTACCTGTIYGKSNVKRIEATFQLLKKNSSGQFIPYYTWPKATANSNYLNWSGTCSVTPGDYRLQVTAVVTNTSNVSETAITYIDKTYK